jgi:integrase
MAQELITQNERGLVLTSPQPIDQNPAAVYLASLGSENSRRSQLQGLKVIANLLAGSPDIFSVSWASLRFQHTAAIRSRLMETYAPATVNRILCALRGTLKAAWRLGQMTEGQRARASDLAGVKGITLPAGRAITGGEIAALVKACEKDPSPAGARDIAIIACLYPGGLRRSEIPNLDLSDYDPTSGALTVRHGKGQRARITYVANGGGRAMADWLVIRGSEPGALFYRINKGGRMIFDRISNQAIYIILAKRGGEAGITDLSPHDLRRTFITDLLEAGVDITTVAKLAGHSSTDTTGLYDRRPEQAKQKAAGLLHLPYRGRT